MTAFPQAPLLMHPHFSPRPWGGTRLGRVLGKDVPACERIGESWELSDHPNGRSRIAGGPFSGVAFGDVLRQFPFPMIGAAHAPDRYPLLVKFIDAEDDLSIQVHPDDAHAAQFGDRGKTECWYVMDCEAGTEIIFGVRPGVTADDLRKGAVDGRVEQMVARHGLAPGMFLFVRAGTVHAILGGTMICEIQQSSDTTYRLWDWNRKPERELHIEKSIDVIDWSASAPKPVHVARVGDLALPLLLTDNEFFRVRALDVPRGDSRELPEDLLPTGAILMAVKGGGRVEAADGGVVLALGSTAFLPAACEGRARIVNTGHDAMRILLAESREL